MEEQLAIMSTGFAAIRDNVLAAVGIVAPIAIVILGITVIWTFAVTFFRRMGR